MIFFFVFILLGLSQTAFTKVVQYDWNITWINAAPDGYVRPVIGVNGQWPCPDIYVDYGDRLIVTIHNGLGNQSTGIHWHGIHMNGTNDMDGASGATQCPLPPGNSLTYDFEVWQVGTYWYHSHNMGQYPDGLRGILVVRDPNAYFANEITGGEILFTASDWYHQQMPTLLETYQSLENAVVNNGSDPAPDAWLINESQTNSFNVEPDKTYLLRVVHVGNFIGTAFVFGSHNLTLVEIDGVYVDPTPQEDLFLRIAPGQRMAFLLHTFNSTEQNYPIWTTMDINMFTPKAGMNPNGTAYLIYNEEKPLPEQMVLYNLNTNTSFLDDALTIPYDKEPLLEPVDVQVTLDTNMTTINGIRRAIINNVTYIGQTVPSLYTAATVGSEYSSNSLVYGQVNPVVVPYGSVVELVINNLNDKLHPWHLHGHQFQVVERPIQFQGKWPGYYSPNSNTPARRDTIMLNERSYAVLRFRANNPGVWLLHCHIEWHVESGLSASIIEAPELLGNLTFPDDHIEACKAYGMPYQGNAAGNVENPLNLTGEVTTFGVSGTYGATYPPSQNTETKRDVRPLNVHVPRLIGDDYRVHPIRL